MTTTDNVIPRLEGATCAKCDRAFTNGEVRAVHETHCRGSYLVVSPPSGPSGPPADSTTVCYCCGKQGHHARDCEE